MSETVERLQDPYLATIYLSISEILKLYNKAIVGLPESDRYDLTRSKWTDFYQELENSVSTFGFKSAVLIVTSRYAGHSPTEFKNIILFYPSTKKIMVDSHCEIMWSDNSGADLGRHPTENYAAGLDDAAKQAVMAKKRLRSKMLGIRTKNSMTTYDKRKLRAFKSVYNLNAQYDGAVMFFVIVKRTRPDTCAGCSDIKYNLENMKISHFKNYIPKANLQIAE